MSTGVIYARYSCDKQTENSILGQIRECKEFAKKNDIDIIDIYKDEAISGRTATKRPAFMRMINDANLHLFDNVIVWKGDRFSRSRADAAKYKSELKKLGIRVLSATEANVTGPEAVLMDGINEAFAEYFSVELAAKVERGMTQNCIDGKFNGGRLPLGYKLNEERKIVVDPEAAENVKWLFYEYSTYGLSIKTLICRAKQKGIKGITGKSLDKSSTRRLLSNRRYIGEYEFKGTKNYSMFPPIIDKTTFDNVQKKLKINQAKRGEFCTNDKYLLNGKIYCGECGSPLKCSGGTSSTGVKRKYYRCIGRKRHVCNLPCFDKKTIEKVVAEAALKYIQNNINVEKAIKKFMEFQQENTPKYSKLIEDLNEINKKINNFTIALESGINVESVIQRLKELQKMKEDKETEIAEHKAGSLILTEDDYRKYFQKWKDVKAIDAKMREYLIKTFIHRVFVYNNKDISIVFGFFRKDETDEDCYSVLSTDREGHQLLIT